MPLTDEEKRQRKREYIVKYYQKNKEKILKQKKEYCEKNKEEIAKQKKEYKQTERGKKCQRIDNWKHRGVKCDDWDKLYDYYVSVKYCEECNCLLDDCSKSRKCLDHSHTTGLFRNVLCHICNVKRG